MRHRELNIVISKLTGQERAILVLRAWREGREPDTNVCRNIPGDELGEYNQLIGTMQHTHEVLGKVALLLEGELKTLNLRYAWLRTLDLWEMDLWGFAFSLSKNLEPLLSIKQRKELASEIGMHLSGRVEPAPRPSRMREELRKIHLQVLEESIPRTWGRLLAADALRAEASEHFDGEEVAHEVLREMLETIRSELGGLAADMEPLAPLPPPALDEEFLETLRAATF